jgi:predicted acyl esterase
MQRSGSRVGSIAMGSRRAPWAFSALSAVCALSAFGLMVGSCSASDSKDADRSGADTTAAATTSTVALPTGASADFEAHGSVGQVWLTDAPADSELTVHGAAGAVMTATTDTEGSLIFRNLASGDYAVTAGTGDAIEVTNTVTVTAPDDAPEEAFFTEQPAFEIGDDNGGYGYLTTRDGTLLAYSVTLPGPPDEGPYPTVIEYSGYSPAAPGSPQPSTLIMQTLGYATVGVNIRGTGCSGGAFQFFEPLQGTDGYDVVETVAAQPWVKHGKVGMVGISYPAIAQLFTAQYQPPHLAAIAPLSVIDDTYRGTLYPGGIYNNGFAKDWAEERQRDAEPFGQGWAARRRDEGDDVCIDNQKLRGQNPDVAELIDLVEFYEPDAVPADNGYHTYANLDALAPTTFVDRINVPVFLAGAWQDEQTGGHFATMLGDFTSAPVTRFTLVNGNHTESLTPAIMSQWFEFLELYVDQEVPDMPIGFRALGPQVIGDSTWGSRVQFPSARFDPEADSYDDVKAQWEAEDPVRILFENGAGCPEIELGAPCPTFEASFSAWPIPETEARAFALSADGELLAGDVEVAAGNNEFAYTGDGQASMFAGGTSDLWRGLPALDWTQPADGAAASYLSEPLSETTVMVGSASVDLWIAANQSDVDLEVTLSEVRPDGTEYYVQVGWLRASHRALDDAASTELRPVHTHRAADAEALSGSLDDVVPVRIELFPFGHVFRAGSQIRLIVDTPGNSRPHWKFDIVRPVDDDATVVIASGGDTPSRIVLPVIPGVGAEAPDEAPPCPALRAQACRPYRP